MSQIGNLTQSSLRATIDGARALTDVVAALASGGERGPNSNDAVLLNIAEAVTHAQLAIAEALRLASRVPVQFEKEGVTA